MYAYGFNIHKAIVTELQVAPEVMHALNEMIKMKRFKEAALLNAEETRNSKLKAAQAFVDAVGVKGEDAVREASAMIHGLVTSGAGSSRPEMVQMFKAMQYSKMVEDT